MIGTWDYLLLLVDLGSQYSIIKTKYGSVFRGGLRSVCLEGKGNFASQYCSDYTYIYNVLFFDTEVSKSGDGNNDEHLLVRFSTIKIKKASSGYFGRI